MSTWLLPLVILMSTPGSPLLVTPANAMATSHANMPPRHDPLIPAIWLWKHGTTHAHSPQFKGTSSHFILADYRTGGKCHFIGVTFHINFYFPDNNRLLSVSFCALQCLKPNPLHTAAFLSSLRYFSDAHYNNNAPKIFTVSMSIFSMSPWHLQPDLNTRIWTAISIEWHV